MAVGADIDIGKIRGAGRVCWRIGLSLYNRPPINIEVEDEIDELDTVEVHNDESHKLQERIKQIAPNTFLYNDNNVKCSFNYETGFGTFVDQTVESYEVEKPCKKSHCYFVLQKWMASKQVPFDLDAEDQDDADNKLEWDQDAANALGKFVELSRQLGRKKCNILWKGDEMAMQSYGRSHSPTSKVVSDNDDWLSHRLDSFSKRRIHQQKFQINAKYRLSDCSYQPGRFVNWTT
uniref:Uncharacterized protein n=1 Tax=Romanomermis culicivorax TaxID=13658 RepID=A0A915IKN3_ROMCU